MKKAKESVKESVKMIKKEIKFFEQKRAPKEIIRHEKAELKSASARSGKR